MRLETRWVVLYGSFLVGSTNFRDLPVLFGHLQLDMHLDVSHLGALMGLQGVCHVIGVCFFGYYSSKAVSRLRLLGYCSVVWATGTFLTATATGVRALFLSRALIGLASGVVGPVSQCLVAEWVAPVARGRAFAWAVAMDFAGQTVGAAGLAWLIQAIGSWRLPLFFMVFLTICFAAFALRSQHTEPKREANDIANLPWFVQISRVFRTPSMRVIILQGFLASTQKEVNALVCLWLQQCGFAAATAASLYSAMVFGNLMGSLFAGYSSDLFATYSPNFGRLVFGQFGEFWRLPALCLLLRTGPSGEFLPTLVCALVYGSTQSLCYVGAVKPLCIEAVAPALVGSAIAIAATVDGAFASAAGGPLVGWSAQFIYGYQQGHISPSNRAALQSALGSVLTVSWLGTFTCLTFLYWTFPSDRLRACLAAHPKVSNLEDGLQADSEGSKLPARTEQLKSELQVDLFIAEPVTPPAKRETFSIRLTPEAKTWEHSLALDLSVPLLLGSGSNDELAVPLILASGETKATCRRGRSLRLHTSDPTHGAPWDSCHLTPMSQPVFLRAGARRQNF